MWDKGNTPALLVAVKTSTDPLDSSLAISQKIRKHLPQNTAVPLLDTQSHHKDMCSTLLKAALFLIAQTWKQPTCSLAE